MTDRKSYATVEPWENRMLGYWAVVEGGIGILGS
jgi:hypothetical protein